MSTLSTKRLTRELADIRSRPLPAGIALVRADDLSSWVLSVRVLGESVYREEAFGLRFVFDGRYPIEAPQVTFINGTIDGQTFAVPLHPHVYSNGHVCASVLGNEWSPVLNVVSLCITMQSMLASNTKLERPEGNDRYVATAPTNPKLTSWVYHDDTV